MCFSNENHHFTPQCEYECVGGCLSEGADSEAGRGDSRASEDRETNCRSEM